MGTTAVTGALERIRAETIVSRLLYAMCTELVQLLDVPRAVVSKVIGDLIVELSEHNRTDSRRPLELFLLSDYPLTQELIETGDLRIVLRSDPQADAAETALLARLGFDAVLMVPLRSRGKSWGLVEIYGGADGFEEAEIATAVALVEGVGELLAELESAS